MVEIAELGRVVKAEKLLGAGEDRNFCTRWGKAQHARLIANWSWGWIRECA